MSHRRTVQPPDLRATERPTDALGMAMKNDWREFSGFGELLCLVLAWMIGMAAVWADYSDRAMSGDRLAVSGTARPSADAFLE